MQRMRPNRNASSTIPSWKQRILACLMLLLSLFLVLDPLWECQDHLDDLRHFGPHGALMIVLIVACAGILLLKSKNALGLLLLPLIAGMLQPLAAAHATTRSIASLAFATLPPPLRI